MELVGALEQELSSGSGSPPSLCDLGQREHPVSLFPQPENGIKPTLDVISVLVCGQNRGRVLHLTSPGRPTWQVLQTQRLKVTMQDDRIIKIPNEE